MTDTQAPAPGTSTPTGAANVAEAQAAAQAAAAAPAPAAPPATAPAAAPAPAEKPTALDVPTDTDEKGKSAYAPTGHKNLDASLAFLGKNGFGPDHPAMQEAVNGNFALLEAQMAEKNVPGSDAYIRLAKAAYDELHAKHEAQRAADKDALHAIVGGEENWAEVTKWGKENATPEQATVINELLSKGGEGMKIAASWLASNYQKATGGIPETDGAGPRVADTTGASVMTTDTLSPSEYGRAVSKARMEYKDKHTPFEQSAVYAKLADRRTRWKG